MKLIFSYNLEEDVSRYYYTALRIAQKVYGNKYYYVLPYLPHDLGKNRGHVVYFPNFNLLHPSDWSTLTKSPSYITNDSFCAYSSYEEISAFVKKNYSIDKQTLNIFKSEWENINTAFDNLVKNMFSSKICAQLSQLNVTVNITNFGSVSSYSIDATPSSLKVMLRKDADISHLVEVILAKVVREYIDDSINNFDILAGYNIDWYLTEGIVDFLLLHTRLSEHFPNFVPTLSATQSTKDSSLALQSRDYLNKLGFGVTDYLRVDGNNIINSLGVEIKGLTSQENNVLAFLISRVNTVCSYEQLADVLWGDEALERFSMYSINKVVFQIRRKLRINGQHNVAIKTRRNIGYILSY